MTEEFKERIFQGARRMVIWGESRADVLHRLEVNGIPADEARQMYERALNERASLLKTGAIRKALGGLGLLLTSVYFFNLLSQGAGTVSSQSVSAVLLIGFLGIWLFFKGLLGCLSARSREGSLKIHASADAVEK